VKISKFALALVVVLPASGVLAQDCDTEGVGHILIIGAKLLHCFNGESLNLLAI